MPWKYEFGIVLSKNGYNRLKVHLIALGKQIIQEEFEYIVIDTKLTPQQILQMRDVLFKETQI